MCRVSDLYIPRLSLPILLQENIFWEYKNRSQTHEWENWDGGRAIPFLVIHKWDFRCSAGTRSPLSRYTQFHFPISALCALPNSVECYSFFQEIQQRVVLYLVHSVLHTQRIVDRELCICTPSNRKYNRYYFLYTVSVGKSVCRPLLCLCHSYIIFEGCLNTN